MQKNLYQFLLVAMLSIATFAHAALPAIPEIPTTLPDVIRQPLITKRQPLAERKLTLIDEADTNKKLCTNIVVGSEQHRSCLELLKNYNARVEALRNDVEQLEDEIDVALDKHNDPMVVDARNVPTGLPKSVDDAIPHTPAGERVRKGFEAIKADDWKAALAWFQDAHNKELGEPGLQRLVELAQFTLQRQSEHAVKPTVTPASVTNRKTDRISNTGKNEELKRSLNDFYLNHPPIWLKPTETDTDWLNEVEPGHTWKQFFRLLTPAKDIQPPTDPADGGSRS